MNRSTNSGISRIRNSNGSLGENIISSNNIHDIKYKELTNNIKESLRLSSYLKVKKEIYKIIQQNQSNQEYVNKVKEIFNKLKSPYQLLDRDTDTQIDFLLSPSENHDIFKPLFKNLELIINLITNLNNDNNNNNNNNSGSSSSNNNNNISNSGSSLNIRSNSSSNKIGINKMNENNEKLTKLYEIYSKSNYEFIRNIIEIIKKSKKRPSINILKCPPVAICEDLEFYEINSLDLAYRMISYDTDEQEFIKKSGCLFPGTQINQVYYKVDDGSHQLKPAKEQAVYQFFKHLLPSATSTFISPTQLIIISHLKTLHYESPIRREIGKLKSKYNTQSIKKIVEFEPEIRTTLENSLDSPIELFCHASTLVKGTKFKDFLEKCEKLHNMDQVIVESINPESFGAHIIASLLLLPTSYKMDNLFIEKGTNNIISVDVDEVLETNEIRKASNGKCYIRIKNILFSIKPLMNLPISNAIRDQLLSYNPSTFILKWLLALKEKENIYDSFISMINEFSDADQQSKKKHFDYLKHCLSLPLKFKQGWIKLMYQRFKKIIIQLNINPKSTYQDLFKCALPLTCEHYELLSKMCKTQLDFIEQIYRNENSLNDLLDNIYKLNNYNLTASQNKVQALIQNLSILEDNFISLQDTIKEFIFITDFDDINECKILNECCKSSLSLSPSTTTIAAALSPSLIECKTDKNLIEWLTLLYSNLNSQDISFNKSWDINKIGILSRLLKYGEPLNFIKNKIIKDLNIVYETVEKHIVRQISQSNNQSFEELVNESLNKKYNIFRLIERDEIEYDESDFIAKGASGKVYKAVYRNNVVAVKVCDTEHISFSGDEFDREVTVMSLIDSDHPNFARIYGANKENPKTFFMVQEFIVAGTLKNVLLNKEKKLDYIDKLSILRDMANAMKYLHSIGIVHRDLKSLNVLISSNNVAKVIDFGISRNVSKHMTSNVGTCLWMGPELFRNEPYTELCDVYSFGIVMWEVYNRREPFEGLDNFKIPVAVMKGERPIITSDTPNEYQKLMKACWADKPKNRPSFAEIHQTLSKMIEKL